MNDTKTKILSAGLQLFNTHGLNNISQRDICRVLKISPGNLTYHFKKKEDIYETLYFQFVQLIESEIALMWQKDLNLESFSVLIEKWFYYLYEYRFIFHDITNLMRVNKKINASYRRIVEERGALFMKVIDALIKQNVIRKEEVDNEYMFLYRRLHIVSDFYLSSVAVFEKDISREAFMQHRDVFYHALYPYLTKKGKSKFLEVLKNW